jgi:predicted adenylyl cyclase CyaB
MSDPTTEVELKARIDDIEAARDRIEKAGAVLVFDGELADRIYDTADRRMDATDHVLRLRTYSGNTGVSSHIDWKGPTSRDSGFKVREELTTGVSDGAATASILERLGYQSVRSIDRWIAQYELTDMTPSGVVIVRFERYPAMDDLVEVEGAPEAIERAINLLRIPREQFSADRLTDFVAAYEARTGRRAAVCKSAFTNV